MGDAENEENEYETYLKNVAVDAERGGGGGGAKAHTPNLFKNMFKLPPTKGRRRKTNAEKALAKAGAAGAAGAGAAAEAARSYVTLNVKNVDPNNNVIINSRGFTLVTKKRKSTRKTRKSTRRHRTKQNRY